MIAGLSPHLTLLFLLFSILLYKVSSYYAPVSHPSIYPCTPDRET